MFLYAGVFALFIKTMSYGGFIDQQSYTDRKICESKIPLMRSVLFAKNGTYIVISQGCKTREEWIKIIRTKPFSGRDA